jgi:hypothetical protein
MSWPKIFLQELFRLEFTGVVLWPSCDRSNPLIANGQSTFASGLVASSATTPAGPDFEELTFLLHDEMFIRPLKAAVSASTDTRLSEKTTSAKVTKVGNREQLFVIKQLHPGVPNARNRSLRQSTDRRRLRYVSGLTSGAALSEPACPAAHNRRVHGIALIKLKAIRRSRVRLSFSSSLLTP